jgi:phosphoribosyl 1,2-cyclic phosphodiesterase
MFRITVFGTGSGGNSALVSDGKTNILIDAGVRLEAIQDDVIFSDIAAVLITHEHGDHAKHAQDLAVRYARPIFATAGTFGEMALKVPSYMQRIVGYGLHHPIGTLTVTPFPLSHDAAEPCGFFIKNALGESLVWVSDTGTMDGLCVHSIMPDCFVLEANYDENDIDKRLEAGELAYDGLHGRLTSEFGHLSVQQAAAWLRENADVEKSHVVILSPHVEVLENNKSLFAEFKNITLPTAFPFTYEFGAKCPFAL